MKFSESLCQLQAVRRCSMSLATLPGGEGTIQSSRYLWHLRVNSIMDIFLLSVGEELNFRGFIRLHRCFIAHLFDVRYAMPGAQVLGSPSNEKTFER